MGDNGWHMDTEAMAAFVAKLDGLAQYLTAWPGMKSRIDALDTAIGRRDRIAAAFDPGYQEATRSVFGIADEVPGAVTQQTSVGSFAVDRYGEAEANATAAMPGGR
jgi:hypothetical protein